MLAGAGNSLEPCRGKTGGLEPVEQGLGLPCSRSGDHRETLAEMGLSGCISMCKPLSQRWSRPLPEPQDPSASIGSCKFSSHVRQETSTKPSPRRDDVQEESRHTHGFVPSSLHPTRLVRHQVGLNVGQKGSRGVSLQRREVREG